MNQNQIIDDSVFESAQAQTAARQFFGKVYAFMFGALLVTSIIAYQYGTPEFLYGNLYNQIRPGFFQPNGLFYVILFAPLGVGLLFQTMINRLSFPVLLLLFTIYSVLIGLCLSTIFLHYTIGSIVGVFFATAGTFAVMAIMGYVTKVDLTRFGSILWMGMIGIVIASVVNVFLGSEMVEYVISIIGVLVFTGLTAYHMQQLKSYALLSMDSDENKSKMAMLGGFTLYVLFINLFISLLSLFGDRE